MKKALVLGLLTGWAANRLLKQLSLPVERPVIHKRRWKVARIEQHDVTILEEGEFTTAQVTERVRELAITAASLRAPFKYAAWPVAED